MLSAFRETFVKPDIAVDAVGGAHHLVVRPAVTVGVLPSAVFTVRNAEAVGDTFLRFEE
jgi:hypothetical protein